MPSRLRALRQSSVIAVAGSVLSCVVATGTAHADSCLTVDNTGACFGPGSTIPSQTVGGPIDVSGLSTPAESVPAPTSVCVLVTCIAKGDPIVSVPSEPVPPVTVPLPQETTPAVTVPVGGPQLYTFLLNCTLDFPFNSPMLGSPGEIQDDLGGPGEDDLVNLLLDDVSYVSNRGATSDYFTDCVQ